MAEQAQFEELARQLSAVGAVKRDMARVMPPDCPMRLRRRTPPPRPARRHAHEQARRAARRGHVGHQPPRRPRRGPRLDRTLRGSGGQTFPDPPPPPPGRDRLEDLSRRTTELLADRLSDWSDDEVVQLIRLMTRLRASFGDCRSTASARLPQPAQGTEQTTRTPAENC